jgi:hypothetical protein
MAKTAGKLKPKAAIRDFLQFLVRESVGSEGAPTPSKTKPLSDVARALRRHWEKG